jgi:hypothetical protein
LPKPKGWTVLFRSNDAADWNTFRDGERVAIPIGQVHSAIRYLSLTRVSNGETLILPITREELLGEPRPIPARGAWWVGTGLQAYGGRHLGIARQPRLVQGRPIGSIAVGFEGWDSFTGWGFGHKTGVADKQYCCWKAKEVPKTTFEIAVTADQLTEEERKLLVVKEEER